MVLAEDSWGGEERHFTTCPQWICLGPPLPEGGQNQFRSFVGVRDAWEALGRQGSGSLPDFPTPPSLLWKTFQSSSPAWGCAVLSPGSHHLQVSSSSHTLLPRSLSLLAPVLSAHKCAVDVLQLLPACSSAELIGTCCLSPCSQSHDSYLHCGVLDSMKQWSLGWDIFLLYFLLLRAHKMHAYIDDTGFHLKAYKPYQYPFVETHQCTLEL